ncbi:S41 family peptidase [Joostella sp. CR20]|uniref:S41 family peptidase n=1 Tax=Joostella sp. CR20 TaxID=2804312 RepID=UPI00313C2664
MKHLFKLRWLLLATLVFAVGCSKDDDSTGGGDDDGGEEVTLENEINDFIWKSMNYWYYYQENVADLDDAKKDNTTAYYNYLNGYSNPESLFNDIVYTAEDDFSWYIEDVDAQANQFRGISESYGLNIGYLVYKQQGSTDVVATVSYVVPDSPASEAGIKRGDLIYKVDGVELTESNYTVINNIFTEPSVTLGLGSYQNGTFVKEASDKSITAVLLSENPVHFHSIIEEDGKKIGYLVYNSFVSTYHEELNDVFTEFKAEGINELVLDLRYNGGGSVLTSSFLASMIQGNRANGTTFSKLTFNDKRNAENGSIYPFFDEAYLYDKTTGEYTNQDIPISRLTNLTRLYVLGSNYTASASEMIINGLRPFMDVILVGRTTTGKNEGSITVYDSGVPYTNSNNRNPNHTVGLQPIVFQIFNSLDENDYDDGFEPNIEVNEAAYAATILPFGDPNEVMLRAALDDIAGTSAKGNLLRANQLQLEEAGKIKGKKFSTEMYILPNEKTFTQK